MDILRLISLLGINLLCGSSSAHISMLPMSKDFVGHGTKYRFQYFVHDERGDYKTQEEAGEGGNARGSYAVEEPDGDLRIVQYTTDIGGGFKAHIKVDHAGRSPSKLQEIDIPAEEMRKLIGENRRKTHQEQKLETSKSYVLGPPRKMSDIVMEQAAAIRQIISKEIEAEERREEAERLQNESNDEVRTAVNSEGKAISIEEQKTYANEADRDASTFSNIKVPVLEPLSQSSVSEGIGNKYGNSFSSIPQTSITELSKSDETLKTSDSKIESIGHMVENEKSGSIKLKNSEYEKVINTDHLEIAQVTTDPRVGIEDVSLSTGTDIMQIANDNVLLGSIKKSQISIEDPKIPESAGIIAPVPHDQQTPVIRVALDPKTLDFSPIFNPDNTEDSKKANLQNLSSQQYPIRVISPVTPSPALAGPLLGGPVRNFSFKNQISFYKPAERKLKILNPDSPREIIADPKNLSELNIMSEHSPEERTLRYDSIDPKNNDQIVLYSPFQQMGPQGNRKTRYVSVPYAILRPYLTSMTNEK